MDKLSSKNRTALGIFYGVFSSIIFGFSFLFTKLGTTYGTEFSLLMWRFVFAAIGFIVLLSFKLIKLDLKGKGVWQLVLLGLLDPCFYFICETFGIAMTTNAESSIILACAPITSFLFARLFLNEKTSIYQKLGVVLTISGVIMTVWSVITELSFSPVGYAFLLCAMTSYSLFGLGISKLSRFSSTEITVVQIFVAGIFFIIAGVISGIMDGNLPEIIRLPFEEPLFLASALFQGIMCSIVGFICCNEAIKMIGMAATSTFLGIETVVAIFSGIFILHEDFAVIELIGGIFALAGVIIANCMLGKGKKKGS